MKDYIPIKKSTLLKFANNARRLGLTEAELSTDQMLEVFSSIKAVDISATDDGNGNVVVTLVGGIAVFDDSNGNVVVG